MKQARIILTVMAIRCIPKDTTALSAFTVIVPPSFKGKIGFILMEKAKEIIRRITLGQAIFRKIFAPSEILTTSIFILICREIEFTQKTTCMQAITKTALLA
ncbi:MAG: hypothetical protein LBP83_09445 [Dysgonamonadaceae bacterium]|jgi:hypothetical protein|nr:hypothetical protein [Dysgonamonadaceae bacterium]